MSSEEILNEEKLIRARLESGVSIANLPSEYPLPEDQVVEIRNKVRIMAWDGSRYVLVEGYDGGKELEYDSNGNLVRLRVRVVREDGSVVELSRTFSYDAQGNLISVGRFEL